MSHGTTRHAAAAGRSGTGPRRMARLLLGRGARAARTRGCRRAQEQLRGVGGWSRRVCLGWPTALHEWMRGPSAATSTLAHIHEPHQANHTRLHAIRAGLRLKAGSPHVKALTCATLSLAPRAHAHARAHTHCRRSRYSSSVQTPGQRSSSTSSSASSPRPCA